MRICFGFLYFMVNEEEVSATFNTVQGYLVEDHHVVSFVIFHLTNYFLSFCVSVQHVAAQLAIIIGNNNRCNTRS